MHKTAVAYAVGKLLQIMGLIMLAPLAISLWDNRALPFSEALTQVETVGFAAAIAAGLVLGSLLVLAFRDGRLFQGTKEGYAIVALGWLALALLASIPFCLYFLATRLGAGGSLVGAFTDAYFEVMSGFTTTGASILSNIEALPRSLLFSRALTHWLGGMGIITLAIAIFPTMGVSGYQMFRGEVPGPNKDKLLPRLRHTASILWGVYLLFTAVETLLLWLGGMTAFDAICHSFATMATGGFSTRNASVAAYQSAYTEWVIIAFMYVAGINFVVHFRALRGDLNSVLHDREFAFYNVVVLSAIVVTTGMLFFSDPQPIREASPSFRHNPMSSVDFAAHCEEQSRPLGQFSEALRISAFQTVSIVTTTGFVTNDYDLWPDFLRLLLLLLMFFGGCAGSTGGGLKMVRVMIVLRVALNELRKLTMPRLVAPLRLGNEVIEEKRIINVVAFFILFILLFVLVAAAMTLFVPDLTTAFSSSIAAIGNVGPGLSGVGPVENYGWIPLPGKWILIVAMLLGRLEVFTVLIVFRMAAWRK